MRRNKRTNLLTSFCIWVQRNNRFLHLALKFAYQINSDSEPVIFKIYFELIFTPTNCIYTSTSASIIKWLSSGSRYKKKIPLSSFILFRPSFLLNRVVYILCLLVVLFNCTKKWRGMGFCQYSLNYQFWYFWVFWTSNDLSHVRLILMKYCLQDV